MLGESSGNGSQGGALVSFMLSDGDRKLRLRGAVSLEKTGGRLFALTSDGPFEWKDGKFAALPAPALKAGETPIGLLAVGDRLGLETPAHLFVLEGTDWRVLTTFKRVAPPKGAFSMDALGPYASAKGMTASAKTLYTGFNHGEWGGGLGYRDLSSGATGNVRDTTETPSDGRPQSGVDDNINAIIADPARDDCAIVASGLIHFMASGRLLRACGDTATLFFSYTPPKSPPESRVIDDLSEAFFGLVPAKDGFWAVSNAAVYRFGSSGQPQRYVLSRYEPWHGLWINRETPGALVLVTEINRRFSVNSGTPLIVPLD